MSKQYLVIEHYERKKFEDLLNEAHVEGWALIHFNSIYARLGSDHQDHHTQFHAIMEKEEQP
ncbi:hypothetical protein LCGC14_1838300 [marine sediment metagenome]|uniref:DUF4177 domain-containing protein n=1 Tax=marine sediment metagenome TaxID=412755 RepID=A0A0F9ITB9_9ZZZZ